MLYTLVEVSSYTRTTQVKITQTKELKFTSNVYQLYRLNVVTIKQTIFIPFFVYEINNLSSYLIQNGNSLKDAI